MRTYETLAIEIQNESKIFRKDNENLKENLLALIEENKRLKSQNPNDLLGAFRNEYINVADSIFNNLRNQLFLIKKVTFKLFIYDSEKIKAIRNF